MFNKKKCNKCGKSIAKKYNFCPNCGWNLSNNEEDKEEWGMIGKEDTFSSVNDLKLPMNSLDMIFNSLMKNLSKQMNELDKEIFKNNSNPENPKKKVIKSGISISISTSGNRPPEIKINSLGMPNNELNGFIQEQPIKKQTKTVSSRPLSQTSIKKLSSLPKEEPSTNIRRLSNKVVYEIDVPGVKSINDISIDQLENSIEIRAIGKDKAYFKIIPVKMPIKKYNLLKNKLVLEFAEE